MKNNILKFRLIIILICSFNFIYSQSITITGKVTDSLNIPLQYVNIGVINKYVGTVTNGKGIFKFNIDNSMANDTLRISSLGYETKDLLIKNIISNSKINVVLNNYTEELEEIILSSNKNSKLYIKGKKKSRSKNEVFFSIPKAKNQNLGAEIGRKFSLGKKKASTLNKYKFFIKNNNFEKIIFRIKLYTIKDNLPHKNINKENIFVEVKNKSSGWINVDLTDYDINIKENIIITVEWIEGSEDGNKLSLPMLIPSFSSVHYYKYGSQSKWKKYKMISTPMILEFKQ
ncbi:carboxypeptidase-like regulatory domain-containing protein [Pseudotamlana carrageenivorans]|uniref:Carboxypeptidase-like regulatory domain-containing protein n=1 Tax=Pseudotamlana carrageenivorans TaxID=2069432 RepID=A0A2I7SKU3_9FLAO|nr:carboxypeptidase-like regulatory domain-containing protein [Tamlana carrageenivorans]AUS06521.1 hypothetical protein C1A40_14210 [Tamlana carrageenivorans]